MPPNLIQKGERRGGRVKGQQNGYTRALKKALILAAEQSKHSKDRGQSLQGYCTYLADEKPALFVSMLGRLIPVQAKVRPDASLSIQNLNVSMSLADMVSAFDQKIKSDYNPAQPLLIAQDDVEVLEDDEQSFDQDA